jgi:hypothetical protein
MDSVASGGAGRRGRGVLNTLSNSPAMRLPLANSGASVVLIARG